MNHRFLPSLILLCLMQAPVAAEEPLPVKRVTHGPKHHFFGYYDVTPWDESGRYLLANEVDFAGRQPKADELLTVGMMDLKEDRYIAFDKTAAWCWQQGTRLQWLGSAPEREVIYNSIADGRYIAIIRDVHSGKTRTLPLPIYALSPDGKQAVTLHFDRLHRLRPGYGYQALPEQHKNDPAPEQAGIWWMDTASGAHKLIIPYAWAVTHQPDQRFTKGAQHWYNHLLFNPSGSRFIFLHRWQKPIAGWWTRMYTAKPDGTDRQLLLDDGMVSHFDWRDDHTILAWTTTRERGDRFYLIDIRTGKREVVGEGVLDRDGHCSYSPDRKWILNDTYPDAKRLQALMLVRASDGRRLDLNKFFLPKELAGPYRCDLHPRWRRDGRMVCIDSGHEETRQMYVVDVSKIVGKE